MNWRAVADRHKKDFCDPQKLNIPKVMRRGDSSHHGSKHMDLLEPSHHAFPSRSVCHHQPVLRCGPLQTAGWQEMAQPQHIDFHRVLPNQREVVIVIWYMDRSVCTRSCSVGLFCLHLGVLQVLARRFRTV